MVKDYFDLVPVINEENTWCVDVNNKVVINAKKRGIFNKVAVRYFNRPENQEIELDGYGSIVWRKINGIKSIRDITDELMRELGEEKDLAHKRAAMFFEMLRIHGLIMFEKS